MKEQLKDINNQLNLLIEQLTNQGYSTELNEAIQKLKSAVYWIELKIEREEKTI